MKTKIKKKAGFVPVRIDEELCKGCGLCVEACPRKLIRISRSSINKKGYHPARFEDPDQSCIYCTQCALVCPEVAIEIVRLEKE